MVQLENFIQVARGKSEGDLLLKNANVVNVYSGENQHWIYPDGNEVYFINTVFITNNYQGVIRADGIESKEVKFFDVENLPDEVTPSNISILDDLRNEIDKYFDEDLF